MYPQKTTNISTHRVHQVHDHEILALNVIRRSSDSVTMQVLISLMINLLS